MQKIKHYLSHAFSEDSLLFDYKTVLFVFSFIHIVLVFFAADYWLALTEYTNFIHRIDVFENPDWWVSDVQVSFSNIKYSFLISMFSWLPVLLHLIAGIPVSWLANSILILKPCLFLYLMAIAIKSSTDKKGNCTAAILLLAFDGFSPMSYNLQRYYFDLYTLYASDWYYLFFLVGIILVYRRNWGYLAVILFLSPLGHPSLGLMGSSFLILLAYSHQIQKPELRKIVFYALAGLFLEAIIIKTVVSGVDKVSAEILWESVITNTHFNFPLHEPSKFFKYLVYNLVFFTVSYLLSSSTRLKKDLLICFAFVASSIVIYFSFIFLKITSGVQLSVMRCSSFLLIMGFVNLGSFDIRSATLWKKILFVVLVLFVIFYGNPGKRHYHLPVDWRDILLYISIIYFPLVLFMKWDFRKSVILFLLIPVLLGPIMFSHDKYRRHKYFVKMFRYISNNIENGSVFLEWGSCYITGESQFRRFTKCPIVSPLHTGDIYYFGNKNMVSDQKYRMETILKRKINEKDIFDPIIQHEVLEKIKHRVWDDERNPPLSKELVENYKRKYNVQYIVSTKRIRPPFKYTEIYADHGYYILKID